MPSSPVAAPINKAPQPPRQRFDDRRYSRPYGYRLPEIKAAFGRKAKDQPKSMLAGGSLQGPLTPGEMAEKLSIPVSHARRVTGG